MPEGCEVTTPSPVLAGEISTVITDGTPHTVVEGSQTSPCPQGGDEYPVPASLQTNTAAGAGAMAQCFP